MAFESVRSHYCSMLYNFSTFSIPDGVRFCVWCVKCAKYLAFDTFERTDENTLIPFNPIVKKKKVIIIRKLFYEDANRTRIKKGHATDILQSVEWRPHTRLQML